MVRVVDRHQLRDEPAHRTAHDVCRLDAERVEQAGCIGGHVAEEICGFCVSAQGGGDVGRAGRIHPGGQPAVAVVETDDAKSATGEQLAKTVVPGEHLHPEPSYEQYRDAVGVAECLVLDLDPVG
jgi:hypothetical protein